MGHGNDRARRGANTRHGGIPSDWGMLEDATDARTGVQRAGSLAETRNFVHRPRLCRGQRPIRHGAVTVGSAGLWDRGNPVAAQGRELREEGRRQQRLSPRLAFSVQLR